MARLPGRNTARRHDQQEKGVAVRDLSLLGGKEGLSCGRSRKQGSLSDRRANPLGTSDKLTIRH
jgi:hypothetical protein